MKIAVYPGSFDPVTKGHLDIIERASGIFDKVVVVAMVNRKKKKPTFSLDERCAFLEKVTTSFSNVEIKSSDALLAEWVKSVGDCVLLKGLRAVSDFESEFQQALINRKLNPKLETLFLPTSEEHLYLSSSVVKEISSLGGDISQFVPEEILDDVQKRLIGGE
ncbi:MAG: pantetheine-phosphate adenylyltransferase [Oscillospiraceae bacterium]|nr:pantetheine-phosphate adenylyltransferase [Oscillospiraceae bacterium]